MVGTAVKFEIGELEEEVRAGNSRRIKEGVDRRGSRYLGEEKVLGEVSEWIRKNNLSLK